MVGDTSSADDVAAAFAKGTWWNNWSCVVFDEGCDTVFTHLILDKLWEGFIYVVALKRAPICNLILSDLFVQQQSVNGSRWRGSTWARCSVWIRVASTTQKKTEREALVFSISIFLHLSSCPLLERFPNIDGQTPPSLWWRTYQKTLQSSYPVWSS